jgi:hypothetical protein
MLLLAKIFPFILGDKVPKDDPNYLCYLKLIDILQIAISPSLSIDTVAYLRILIEEHHTSFVAIYPNVSFTPKLHYMVHYPQQIIEQGPLIRAWTMRYEAKLNYFKGIARAGNFKNITLTLASRHQRWLSYHLNAGSLFTLDISRGPILDSKMLSEHNTDMTLSIQQHFPSISPSQVVAIFRWVSISGIKYTNDNCYLIRSVNKEPSFSKVEKILNLNNDFTCVRFLVSVCEVALYDESLLAYAIRHTNRVELLPI